MICEECGHVFEEPKRIIERLDDDAWGAGPSQYTVSVCPMCHSDEIDEYTEDEEYGTEQ